MPSSQHTQSNTNKDRVNSAAGKIFLCAFLAVALIATASVLSLHFAFTHADTALDKDGVPEIWANAAENSVAVDSSVDTITFDDSAEPFVEYRVRLENTSASQLYLTHFASYISSAEQSGFVPLNGTNLEYTYTPEQNDSWQQLAVSAPANNLDGSKLSEHLALGAASTPFNALYLRYNVAYDPEHADQLSVKVSSLTSSDNDTSSALSVASTTPELLAKTDSSEVAISDDPAISTKTVTENPLTAGSERTEVLGVSSSLAPNLTIIGGILPDFQLDSYALLGAGQLILLAAIGVLIISFVIYFFTFKIRRK